MTTHNIRLKKPAFRGKKRTIKIRSREIISTIERTIKSAIATITTIRAIIIITIIMTLINTDKIAKSMITI